MMGQCLLFWWKQLEQLPQLELHLLLFLLNVCLTTNNLVWSINFFFNISWVGWWVKLGKTIITFHSQWCHMQWNYSFKTIVGLYGLQEFGHVLIAFWLRPLGEPAKKLLKKVIMQWVIMWAGPYWLIKLQSHFMPLTIIAHIMELWLRKLLVSFRIYNLWKIREKSFEYER